MDCTLYNHKLFARDTHFSARELRRGTWHLAFPADNRHTASIIDRCAEFGLHLYCRIYGYTLLAVRKQERRWRLGTLLRTSCLQMHLRPVKKS